MWDYPVKEQYTHILRVIEQTGPVSSPEEGIMIVSKRRNYESNHLNLFYSVVQIIKNSKR